MKTTIKLYTSLLFTFLFVFQVSFGQKKEKDEHNISFSTFNHNAEIDSGIWFGTIEKEKVCIQLMDSRNRSNPSFMIGLCIPVEEFTMNSEEGFELNKPSGTIKFEGAFPSDKGNGDFTFVKNSEFEAFLNKEGITSNGVGRDHYFKLFLGDVSKEYVLGLKKHGYQPTLKQLGKLGIHDVDLSYINALAKTNYNGLELDMLLKFAIHNISINYIKDLEKAGYGDIDANMVKKFAIHNVSIDYIRGLSNAGYGNLDPNMIKNFAVHNISLDYIEGLSSVGYRNLDPSMLKKFAVHNINAKYIKSLQDLKLNPISAETIKKAKIHNVSASFVKDAIGRGHSYTSLSDYIRLKVRGTR